MPRRRRFPIRKISTRKITKSLNGLPFLVATYACFKRELFHRIYPQLHTHKLRTRTQLWRQNNSILCSYTVRTNAFSVPTLLEQHNFLFQHCQNKCIFCSYTVRTTANSVPKLLEQQHFLFQHCQNNRIFCSYTVRTTAFSVSTLL